MGPFGKKQERRLRVWPGRLGSRAFAAPKRLRPRRRGASDPAFRAIRPGSWEPAGLPVARCDRIAIAARGVWSQAPRKSPWWSAERRGSLRRGPGYAPQAYPGPFAPARGVSQTPAPFGAPLPSQKGSNAEDLRKSRAPRAAETSDHTYTGSRSPNVMLARIYPRRAGACRRRVAGCARGLMFLRLDRLSPEQTRHS